MFYEANGNLVIPETFTNVESDIDIIQNLIDQLNPFYNDIYELCINIFSNPESISNYKIDGLQFGFICPGAVNTIIYISENLCNMCGEKSEALENIKELTDLLFFIEIIVIYSKHISDQNNNSLVQSKNIIGDNFCEYSKNIVDLISSEISKLKTNIKENLPDNFYHIRHQELICSANDENSTLADKRVELIKNIYN